MTARQIEARDMAEHGAQKAAARLDLYVRIRARAAADKDKTVSLLAARFGVARDTVSRALGRK